MYLSGWLFVYVCVFVRMWSVCLLVVLLGCLSLRVCVLLRLFLYVSVCAGVWLCICVFMFVCLRVTQLVS